MPLCRNRGTGDDMTDEPKNTPPRDDADCLHAALLKMISIRGGGRFQVITYSGDGGADDKMDYVSMAKAVRAARAYVRGKEGLSCPMKGRSSMTKWSGASCGSSVSSPKAHSPDRENPSLRSYWQRAAPREERPFAVSPAVRPVYGLCRGSPSQGGISHPAPPERAL